MRFSKLTDEQEQFVEDVFYRWFAAETWAERWDAVSSLPTLGEGVAGYVYEYQGYALKLCRGHDCSDDWLRFAIRKQSNPFVPKIKFFLQKRKGTPYVCVMEMLEKQNDDDDPNYEVRQQLQALDFSPEHKSSMGSRTQALYERWLHAQSSSDFVPVKRKLAQYKGNLDLHTGNYMNRVNKDGTRQLVLTDPLLKWR